MPRRGYLSVTLPQQTLVKVRKIVRSPLGTNYRSVSEYIAKAVEEKLERNGGIDLVSVKEVSLEDAKSRILEYLSSHTGAYYPSDIAFTLGIDLEVVFEAVRALMSESKVEVADLKREMIAR